MGGGGGLLIWSGKVTLRSCTISGNKAERGSGLYLHRGEVTCTSCTISDNNGAGNNVYNIGGGLYIYSGKSYTTSS